MNTLDQVSVRRLALARSGLLKPDWTGFRIRRPRSEQAARRACHELVRKLGYLQLDTVPIAGARSQAIVLASRLPGLSTPVAEELLRPGAPIFEYWGHEASWLPIEMYPLFAFRRAAFAQHPWWGDVVGRHPEVAETLRRRLREEGPLRSVDLHGANHGGWWNLKAASRVATALWSSGELAIRERRGFQRTYDLADRVIPESVRSVRVNDEDSLDRLLLVALDGHGWAPAGLLARTWRLKGMATQIRASLDRLREAGTVVPCAAVDVEGRTTSGWIRPPDLELAERLRAVRPRADRGVLLSPFDPVLWDRERVRRFFSFDQVLEIYKPAAQRVYGYYCLPVLAGDRLIARFDLKADRRNGRLHVLSCRYEGADPDRGDTRQVEAARSGLERFAGAVGLAPSGSPE